VQLAPLFPPYAESCFEQGSDLMGHVTGWIPFDSGPQPA